jgi:hypothetical protein
VTSHELEFQQRLEDPNLTPRFCLAGCIYVIFYCRAGEAISRDYRLREFSPGCSRSLYILLQDKQVLQSDLLGTLEKQLWDHRQRRLSDAKLLSLKSPRFKGVPLLAVNRFLELVACANVPPGETQKMSIHAASGSLHRLSHCKLRAALRSPTVRSTSCILQRTAARDDNMFNTVPHCFAAFPSLHVCRRRKLVKRFT